ncbi:hypothetical protein NC652_018507 [Populus alba x Populus x berolinensis]|nr:hypothetical protein NC652_018507 [Populus alba x Populus x berolinensis]
MEMQEGMVCMEVVVVNCRGRSRQRARMNGKSQPKRTSAKARLSPRQIHNLVLLFDAYNDGHLTSP